MTRRPFNPVDRINPGVIRTRRLLDPARSAHVRSGTFRPANQWRPKTGHQTDVRNRALLLAKHLPWLPQYNFARS